MSGRTRLLVFLLALACLLPSLVVLIVKMPSFSAHALPYGDLINSRAPYERHVTNAVSAVNFDYRGVDTLGEEFMLLCAVTGVAVLDCQGARPAVSRIRKASTRAAARS